MEHMFHPFVIDNEPVFPEKKIGLHKVDLHNNSIFFLVRKSLIRILFELILFATPALMAFCLAIFIIELSISAPRISS